MDSNEAPAGRLGDGVLADANFNSSLPTYTAFQLKEGKGSTKKVWKQVTEKPNFQVTAI